VVFTFDDGPHPRRTMKILDILDRHCVKAVFFLIGDMAHRHPEIVREIHRRGHVIGTHTWSHPLRLVRFSSKHAQAEIERGFWAASDALGDPAAVAPFFRFPGLIQSAPLRKYLAKRDIAIWSVDAISGDSERATAKILPRRLMRRLKKRGHGILLFHDIKKSTVQALPTIIKTLHKKGYRAVQVVPTKPVSLLKQKALTRLERARKKELTQRRHKRAHFR
jgi:peptidoglycan/xylan/chitin deacetylase (PgdA/CDA1 family)